jgi:hypothetical protein
MNNPLSLSSIKLDLFSRQGSHVKTASGFVLEVRRRYYLITNQHVFSQGEIPGEGQQGPVSKPYTLKTSIRIHSGQGENSFLLDAALRKRLTIPLYDAQDTPQWMEIDANGQHQPFVDIAALPIQFDLTLELLSSNTPGIYLNKSPRSGISNYWMKISAIPISAMDTDVEYGPPDTVHVIGYPRGWAPEGPDKSTSAFWRTSFIASELHEAGRTRSDVFFIDPCAPQGMTGSPVVGLKDNRPKLLGVYSDDSTAEFGADAGYVWGAWLLKDLISPRRST